jgi:hypothetical protein
MDISQGIPALSVYKIKRSWPTLNKSMAEIHFFQEFWALQTAFRTTPHSKEYNQYSITQY